MSMEMSMTSFLNCRQKSVIKNNMAQKKQIDPKVAAARKLIGVNSDSRQYFFVKATPQMFDWLRENGFLDIIKAVPADRSAPQPYMSELEYLEKVTESIPSKVVDFMLEVASTDESCNPVVIDRFVRICGDLPVDELVRMTKKIKKENWVRLVGGLGRWGFIYEKILAKLFEAGKFEAFLDVAEVVLTTKTTEEAAASRRGLSLDTPFLLHDLHYTKIFERLVEIDPAHRESALHVVSEVLTKVVTLEDRETEDDPFEITDPFPLYDTDFFDLEVGTERHLSGREDVRDLAAVAAKLSGDLVADACGSSPNDAHRIYEKYIKSLPNSRAMYRLAIFVLSRCPSALGEEIKNALWKVFEHERIWSIVAGAEYERLLQKCFAGLPEDQKREYVERVHKLLASDPALKNTGHDIFSSIVSSLTDEERTQAEAAFGALNPEHVPTPSIGETRSGTVVPQAPGDSALWGGPVDEIAAALKGRFSPENLKKMPGYEADFLRPINEEGVGDELRKQMELRPADFLAEAPSFFDREGMAPHYTYSFLRGAYELLKDDKVEGIDLRPLNALLEAIRDSGSKEPFKDGEGERRGWSADWMSVHRQMTDVVIELLREPEGDPRFDFGAHRDTLLATISYLLSHPHPTEKENDVSTASFKRQDPGSREYVLSDPHAVAINSVRGEAFQALGSFVFLDGKLLAPTGKKIGDDVKGLYERVLRAERTQALMFMFGRYLPTFYYRDTKWILGLLPEIFSPDPSKKDLYLAAWEGYLSVAIYEEMFAEPQIAALYQRAIDDSDADYTKRHYIHELGEALATHLALAFMHYPAAGFDSHLFKAFWGHDIGNRHAAFVQFLGGKYLSGKSEDADGFLAKTPAAKERLKEFWDWLLARGASIGVLANFGYWIDAEKGVLDPAWLASRVKTTLEKTSGELEWEYGLQKSISQLAVAAPADTLAILRSHLLDWGLKAGVSQRFFFLREDWQDAFRILFENPSTKAGTEALINELVFKGSRTYWDLKKIIDPNA